MTAAVWSVGELTAYLKRLLETDALLSQVQVRGGSSNFKQPDGRGELHQRFEALKARLEAEGLFAPERKRRLPRFPRAIALVTSPTRAAIRDLLNILSRRY